MEPNFKNFNKNKILAAYQFNYFNKIGYQWKFYLKIIKLYIKFIFKN